MNFYAGITLLVIALCGGAGALARAWIIKHVDTIAKKTALTEGLAMLVVNILGCALSALVLIFAARLGLDSPWNICVSTGLLGGFTSFSTPCATSARLIEHKRYAHAIRYAVIMIALCSLAYLSCAYISVTLV